MKKTLYFTAVILFIFLYISCAPIKSVESIPAQHTDIQTKAQQVLPIPSREVPMDTTVRTGKLQNGMTYYIKHNEEPKERASFYIIQNVGALLEEDNQNGLAHFLEHMAFNGTKHFPEKGILNTLEKHGIAFGKNINAYTSFNETVYNINEVPVTHPGLIDTCLLVLNDWSNYLSLTDEEIDAERGVITEEWRTRRSAQSRMRDQYFPVLFKDSKFAVRNVIGDMEVVKNFEYETLRKFYHNWYRSDLQAIAIIGDLDVDAVEKSVKAMFSKIPAVDNPPVRKSFKVPEHTDTRFVIATDEEASNSAITVYIKHNSIEPEKKDLDYLREKTIRSLFNRMMRDRISELLQKGDPPFIFGRIGYSGFVRGYDVMSISATANPNEEAKALKAIYNETQRLYRHGFTSAELERAKTNYLTYLESAYKQRDKISNDRFSYSYIDHFLSNEPITSMEFDWKFARKIIPTVSLEEVSSKAGKWITPENRVIIVTGPKEEAKHISETEALAIMQEVDNSEIEPYKEEEISTTLVDEELTGSKIIAVKQLEDFDAVEWKLANNTRVIYRHANFEKDNVALYAYSRGGSSIFEDETMAATKMLDQFVGAFGVGDFDAIALKKATTGKKASLNTSLSYLYEAFSGSSTPKDFETMMQLLYLQFEKPRFDQEAYDALKSRYVAYLTNMANEPRKIISDSLSLIFTQNHPRTKLMTPELFDEISLPQMEEVFNNRFMDAGDFTFFIVGNVNKDTVKSMVAKYIGALKDDHREELWIDRKVNGPEGKTTKEIEIPMETKKTTVVINFENDAAYNPVSNLSLIIFEGILRLRYTEEIREKEGGSYGVRVSSSYSHYPVAEKNLRLRFDTDPDKAEYLKSIIYREIDKILENGPTQVDLDKVIENMQKEREQSKLHNRYWMSVLRNYYMHGVNTNDPENYENILSNMTREKIRQFAQQFISTADVVDVIFKPKPEVVTAE